MSNFYQKYLNNQTNALSRLSKKELKALQSLLEAGLEDKEASQKPIQIRDIVPIEQWVNDSYYIGKAGVSLYDYWKEELIDIFKEKDNPQYNEIIIEGGLGCVALNTIYSTSLGNLSLSQLIEMKKDGLLRNATIPSDKGQVAILDVNSVGIKKTKKILFSNGVYVEGTCDHRIKVLSRDGEVFWRRFDELSENTQVLYCNKNLPKIENIPLEKAKKKWRDYLYWNNCSIIYPVEVEDGKCECGDVTVEGAVYVRDGLINHNTGKSTFATHVVQRFFYELSCWKNIPALFGLKNTTSISGMYFSLTKEQAEISGFRDIKNLIDDTQYFKDHFPRNDRLDSRLDFPENIFIYYGSNVTHQISLNLVLSIVDEANFFKDAKSKKKGSDPMMGSKVADLHSSLLNRQASRFTGKEGNKSLSILISSPTFYSSYTQTRIELAKSNPHAKVIKPRKWDTQPELYSGKKFYVFLGNEKLDPKILENKEDLNIVCESMDAPPVIFDDIEDAIDECPPYVKDVIGDVPIELYENYRTNLIKSVGDFSAHSVQTQGKLFNSRKIFYSCVDRDLPNLFFKTAFTVSTNRSGDSNSIEHYLRMPFSHQEKKRFIHIDQSTTGDCTGVSSVYLDDAIIDDNGQELKRVVVDFSIRIVPPTDGGQIDIERVRYFIFYMRNNLKLKIGKVTYDQFQSSESLQHLKKAGINCGKQSVESDVPYLSFLNLFYQNRIKMSEQAATLIAEEIFDLQHFRDLKKVDHVEGKSKDVCDSVVGATWAALNDDLAVDKPRHSIEEARAIIAANTEGRVAQGRDGLFNPMSFVSFGKKY